MNKALFLVICFVMLLSSCSSDGDLVFNNIDNNVKKYVVNLDIQSDAFKIDKTPMKSLIEKAELLQIVAYKESGEVYSNTIYKTAAIDSLSIGAGKVSLSIQLPEGNYHLALLSVYQINAAIKESFVIFPENYDTDYYDNGNASMSTSSNQYVYYETIDITVPDNNIQDSISVELKPMWSEIELNVKDILSANIPDSITSVRFSYTPYYKGFSIKTKLATRGVYTESIYYDPIGDRKANAIYIPNKKYNEVILKYNVAKGNDDSMGFNCEYLNYPMTASGPVVIATREIRFSNKLENGNKYIITGKLGDMPTKNSSQSMNITLGEFNPKDEVIEF